MSQKLSRTLAIFADNVIEQAREIALDYTTETLTFEEADESLSCLRRTLWGVSQGLMSAEIVDEGDAIKTAFTEVKELRSTIYDNYLNVRKYDNDLRNGLRAKFLDVWGDRV